MASFKSMFGGRLKKVSVGMLNILILHNTHARTHTRARTHTHTHTKRERVANNITIFTIILLTRCVPDALVYLSSLYY